MDWTTTADAEWTTTDGAEWFAPEDPLTVSVTPDDGDYLVRGVQVV